MLELILINHKIANHYHLSSGKTRALFGIIELTYSYKYYFILLCLLSSFLLFIGKRKKEDTRIFWVGVALNMISFIMVFIPTWKFLV